jgi:elongation factor Ts
MAITASQVKELREMTGAGMMDAKNALVEANGDIEKATELLRQKGIATAQKKSGRVAAEGQVASFVTADKQSGVLVEVNCETDFVAKGDAFMQVVSSISEHIVAVAPSSVEQLMQSDLAGQPVSGYVTERISAIKENINVRRFAFYQCKQPGMVHSYIHTGGKVGVLLELVTGKPETVTHETFQHLVRDLAMQIASSAPDFRVREDIAPSVIEEETRVEMGKEDLANKPEEIKRKIVEGRVSKLLGQRCLAEQPFIKDPAKMVSEMIESCARALSDTIEVSRFTRYMLGEGIEKEVTNFAAEVAAVAKL